MKCERKKIIKKINYILEAILVLVFWIVFKLLPIDVASSVSGRLLQFIGKFLSASKIAKRNLDLCYPDKSETWKRGIIEGMWNNLGRILGEMPHWYCMSDEEFNQRVQISDQLTKNKLFNNKRMIILSAHFGNWELCNRLAQYKKLNLCLIHKHMNNPFVNKFINYTREKTGITLLPKNLSGLKNIIKEIRAPNGKMIGMLFDQRYNEGIDVDFFGMDASTTKTPATIGKYYNVPLVFCKVTRVVDNRVNYDNYTNNNNDKKFKNKNINVNGNIKKWKAKYSVEFSEPFLIKDIILKNTQKNIKEIDHIKYAMSYLNSVIEKWIRQNPEQWFWVHRRFKIHNYKSSNTNKLNIIKESKKTK